MQSIEEFFSLKNIMENDSLRQCVEEITGLPSLPVIAREIIALTEDSLISVSRLEKILERDPAISAKVLSVAGSAFYGFSSPVRTLNNAIFRIGFESVKNIALGISIMTVLNDRKHRAPDYERIFNHSVVVGFIARILSKRFILNITDEIIVSGILHDIGRLIMSRYFPDRYRDVLNILKDGKNPLEAEQEIFKFNHSDIGNWLASKWNLPDTISDVVLYHHDPSHARGNLAHVATVHVADYIVNHSIIRSTAPDCVSPFDPSCLAMLGITEDNLNDVVTEVKNGEFFQGLFL